MKLNKIVIGMAAAGMFAALAAPAQAVVLDSWQATINGNTYTDIGRLSLTGGNAIIEQEVNGSGQVFGGARFIESGNIFSISYVLDNVVGPGDTVVGVPAVFAPNDRINITTAPASGVVTGSSSGGGFSFIFQSGSVLVEEAVSGDDLAIGTLVGVGGTLNNTAGFAGANGQSVQDAIFTALLNGFVIRDSSGTPLDISTLVFEAQTNNQVTAVSGPAACTFDATAICLTLNINSNGDGFLNRIPEPATLALLGLGLFGMGATLRKRKTS